MDLSLRSKASRLARKKKNIGILVPLLAPTRLVDGCRLRVSRARAGRCQEFFFFVQLNIL